MAPLHALDHLRDLPIPQGLTPDISASAYRPAIPGRRWSLLLRRSPIWSAGCRRVVPGNLDRVLPVDDAAAAALKKRTLTNIYSARPAWLDHAHQALDRAVAEAMAGARICDGL